MSEIKNHIHDDQEMHRMKVAGVVRPQTSDYKRSLRLELLWIVDRAMIPIPLSNIVSISAFSTGLMTDYGTGCHSYLIIRSHTLMISALMT